MTSPVNHGVNREFGPEEGTTVSPAPEDSRGAAAGPTGQIGGAAPTPLVVAAAGTALQGLVVIGYGVSELLHVTSGRVTMGLTTAAFFLAFGAGLVLCAWGLRQVRPRARGLVLFAQLVWLGLAWNFRDGDTRLVAIGLAVAAVVVLVGMLHPQTMAALEAAARREDEPSGPVGSD